MIYIELCTNGHLRLVGGHDDNEGRVEICSNGVWATIWDINWDISDALVVCQQLGYPRSLSNASLYLYKRLQCNYYNMQAG